MILFRLLSWPYVRKHVVRALLTTAGIVLGVAVFVGMRTANQNVLSAFSRTVDRIAGKTELQITAGEAGFGEDVLDKVQAASAVRVAVPVIEAVVDTRLKGQGHLLILGVDMTGDRSLRDYDLESGDEAVIDDPLVFLAQPDSIIVSKEFADRNALTSGARFTLGTVEGEKTFTIRGVMKSTGLSSAFGGNLAVMDVYAAQKMFGRGRTFDRIDLGVKPGVSIEECERQLSAVLGPGFQVDPPSGRGKQFEAILSAYTMMVGTSSFFALFIGMFIIYNSFAIAVAERRSEIGILRALGATRRQIRWLFLGESAIAGLMGSLGGLGFGILIAKGIVVSIRTVITDVYGVTQTAEAVTASPMLLAVAVVIGVGTSLVGAAIPSAAAARVDPVRALQKGKYQVLSAGENRLRVILALVLAVACGAGLVFGAWKPAFYASYVLAIAVAVLLSPLLTLGLSKAMRPILKFLRPVEGALAADSLIQSPRRTSASVAALMLSLALVIAFGGLSRSAYSSLVDWMNIAFNPDLFISPSQNIAIRTIRFPHEMEAEIQAMPEVARVQTVRDARIMFRGTPIMLVAVDINNIAQTVRVPPVAGDPNQMYRRAAAGEGVIISDNLSGLQHLRFGETIDVPSPDGFIRLPIVGIITDYSDQNGTILIDRTVFERHWNDDSINVFRLYLKPGAQPGDVRQRILERYSGRRQVFVFTNGDLKQYVMRVTDQWLSLTSVQIAVAVLVAILGIVNTLTVSITDRRRELGVLRAVGGLRGQIRRTIWIEALTTGTLGLTLGLLLGAINLYYTLEIGRMDIVGMRFNYQFPFGTAAMLVPIMLGAAFVAAIWPAESAVRGSLVEALEYE